MTDRQTLKGQARETAQDAPTADPQTAAEAIADAKGHARPAESSTQPVYATQQKGDVLENGENIHRDKDAIISEFDRPSDNVVD